MKHLRYALFFALVIFAAGCAPEKIRFEFAGETPEGAAFPDTEFAVLSDLHIYDPSLGVSGSAFDKTMSSDRKLLLDSRELLDYAIQTIIGRGVRFVLISGDLTKDGEVVNHRLMADKLKAFTEAGIGVYVIPGNHDINNPDAVSYDGDNTAPVPSVSAEDFSRIYGDFGFNAALARDSDSLAYVAEPVSGLWLLALDSCRYRENVPGKEEIVSGKISQQTADWIAGVLKDAARQGKAVMAMTHHGVVEHWNGQSKLHPDYLVSGYADFGRFLASHNVRLVFTGHYHALDISRAESGGKFIHDIETGSLITAPCPVRFAELKGNTLRLRTETLVDKIYPQTDFADNARAFVKKTVMLEALGVLKQYKVSGADADYISNAVGDAFDAHYSGDENPALRPSFDRAKLGLWGRFVYGRQKYVLDGLWADLPPSDNNVELQL